MIFNRQFLIFIVGGASSALIDIGIMQTLIWFGINNLLATSVGFFSGLLFNYVFHAKMTFRSEMSFFVALRFCTLAALNYLVTLFLVYVAYDIFHQSALLGKIISLPVVAVNGFILGKLWVFKT